MRRFRSVSAMLLVLATLATMAWAGDSWKDKPYQQWNKKDVEKVLKDSPWARSTTVTASWLREAMTSNPVMSQQGSAGMSGTGSMNAPAGLGMRPQEQDAKFVALWNSAHTAREAIVRGEVLAGKMTDAEAASELAKAPTDYLITISGTDMTPLGMAGVGALSDGTRLELKESKQQFAPSAIYFNRSADGSRVTSVTFHFPRMANSEPTIAANEKEADLICNLKHVKLKFRFELDKMVTRGGRDL